MNPHLYPPGLIGMIRQHPKPFENPPGLGENPGRDRLDFSARPPAIGSRRVLASDAGNPDDMADTTVKAFLDYQKSHWTHLKLQEKADVSYIDTNLPWLTKLNQRNPDDPDFTHPLILDKLLPKAQEKSIREDELKFLIRTGAGLARELSKTTTYHRGPLTLTDGEGIQYLVTNSEVLTRCLSWYLMALAATQDLIREREANAQQASSPSQSSAEKITDIASSGTYLLKDSGYRFYEFLKSAPTCGNRPSSHFSARDDKRLKPGCCGLRAVKHKGIDDYQSKLPSQGGNLLFGSLPDDITFMKFERAGMPKLFGSESQNSVRLKFSRFGEGIRRNLVHLWHWKQSKDPKHHNQKQGSKEVNSCRLERLQKGSLQDLYNHVIAFLKNAPNEGLCSRNEFKEWEKAINNRGFLALNEIKTKLSTRISNFSNGHNEHSTVKSTWNNLLEQIETEKKQYESPIDQGIPRRGAEVHLNPNPKAYKDYVQSLIADLVPNQLTQASPQRNHRNGFSDNEQAENKASENVTSSNISNAPFDSNLSIISRRDTISNFDDDEDDENVNDNELCKIHELPRKDIKIRPDMNNRLANQRRPFLKDVFRKQILTRSSSSDTSSD